MKIRNLRKNEIGFLEEMLYEALFVPEGSPKFPKTIIRDPLLSKYIEDWPKDDFDMALVAEIQGKLVGAIWGRLFSSQNRGFGFVDEGTPELSMAVLEKYRGRGIGTQLMYAIEEAYARHGVKTLSLSVDKSNPALGLYVKRGFGAVSEEGTSLTLKRRLNPRNVPG